MSRGHYIVGVVVSAFAAIAFLFIAAALSEHYPFEMNAGAKGLFVVIPLHVAASWELSRDAALAVAFAWYFSVFFACTMGYLVRKKRRAQRNSI